jgi:hypothetical protein
MSLMFNFFKKDKVIDADQKFLDVWKAINRLENSNLDIKNSLEKLEIKALESRKLYHKKLSQLYGKETEEEKPKDLYSSVLLPEDGNIKRDQ